MGKKRKDIPRGLTEFIIEDSHTTCQNILDTVRWYTKRCSGVIPTEEQENKIRAIYKYDPILMGIIAEAFFEKGYDSF